MDEVPRPIPAPSPTVRVREWIEWFGVARLATSAVAVVVVCAGAWWLVKTPPPPSEAALPVASSALGSSPAETLATPVGSTDVDGADASGILVVHVAGAVEQPGVYEVEAGSRVRVVIDRAGGPTPNADADALNLAAVVADATRIYVPAIGEAVPTPVVDQTGTAESGGPVGPVDVNRATTDELESLPGVGPATATAIVTERDRNGPFATVDDLERVPGIGPAKLDALRGLVTT